VQALDPEGPRASAQSPEFYDGVLFAAQAMSETITRLLAEARAGLAPIRLSPGEIADRARAAVEAGRAAEAAARGARAPRRAHG